MKYLIALAALLAAVACQALLQQRQKHDGKHSWPLWWGSIAFGLVFALLVVPDVMSAMNRPSLPPLSQVRQAVGIDRGDAVVACEQQARRLAMFPETVDFAWLSAQARNDADGTTVRTTFRARNAFNVPEQFLITCTVSARGRVDAVVVPARS